MATTLASPSRIALLISDMSAGGAQRVMSILANSWAANHQVTLFTLDDGAESHYSLASQVMRRPLHLASRSASPAEAILRNAERIYHLRTALMSASPDVVLSFMLRTNVLLCAALLGTRIPIAVSDRIFPTREEHSHAELYARNTAYHRADKIILQTSDVIGTLPKHLSPRTVVIPNPISPSVLRQKMATSEAATKPRFVAAGRLTAQKGFDLLIRAHARLTTSEPRWPLVIYGEGPERGALAELAARLGTTEQVEFRGVAPDLPRELQEGGTFVLSSRYEGFPNVLLEAMAMGLPCISTHCRSGPADIIDHERSGLLTQDISERGLEREMLRLMQDRDLRAQIARNAQDVRVRYSVDSILPRWHAALTNAIEYAT